MNFSFPELWKLISPLDYCNKTPDIYIYICNMCMCIYIYIYSFLVHVSASAMECANASVFCLICTLWFMWISNDKRVTWLNYTNIHDTIIRCHKVFARYSVMLIIFARKTYVLLLLLFFSFFFSFCCCCFFPVSINAPLGLIKINCHWCFRRGAHKLMWVSCPLCSCYSLLNCRLKYNVLILCFLDVMSLL